MAVALQVVARGDGEAWQARLLAQAQAVQQQLGQAGRVAFFGHGERDPARAGRRDGLHHRFALAGGHIHAPQCPRHLPAQALSVGHAHGIQAVLRTQCVHQIGPRHAHTVDAPARVASGQQCVKHHGLVGPVKGTQTQVQHTGGVGPAVIGGGVDGSGQVAEGGGRQFHGVGRVGLGRGALGPGVLKRLGVFVRML